MTCRTVIVLVSLFGMLTSPVAAEPLQCDAIAATVDAPDPALARQVCESARDARDALLACNVPITRDLTITVADRIEPECLGVYHCGEDRIEILSPAGVEAYREGDGVFADVPVDRYFDSILLHEMAHAAYDAVPCPFGTCIATSEYLAYALQIRSLTDADRVAILSDTDDAEMVTRDEVNPFVLMMAPDIFARKAWLHFSQRPDPCDYARQIMSGDVLLDYERP